MPLPRSAEAASAPSVSSFFDDTGVGTPSVRTLASPTALGLPNGARGMPLRRIRAVRRVSSARQVTRRSGTEVFFFGALLRRPRAGAEPAGVGRPQVIGTPDGLKRSPPRLQRNRNTVLSAHLPGGEPVQPQVRTRGGGAEVRGTSGNRRDGCKQAGDGDPAMKEAEFRTAPPMPCARHAPGL